MFCLTSHDSPLSAPERQAGGFCRRQEVPKSFPLALGPPQGPADSDEATEWIRRNKLEAMAEPVEVWKPKLFRLAKGGKTVWCSSLNCESVGAFTCG